MMLEGKKSEIELTASILKKRTFCVFDLTMLATCKPRQKKLKAHHGSKTGNLSKVDQQHLEEHHTTH